MGSMRSNGKGGKVFKALGAGPPGVLAAAARVSGSAVHDLQLDAAVECVRRVVAAVADDRLARPGADGGDPLGQRGRFLHELALNALPFMANFISL